MRRAFLVIALATTLTGCGFNGIRLARASDVSEAGTTAVTLARNVMQQVAAARNKTNVSLQTAMVPLPLQRPRPVKPWT